MKVTAVKTMVLENEPPYIGGKYFLILQIETDEGIVGLGEKLREARSTPVTGRTSNLRSR